MCSYAEALDMADRHAILKNGCKEIAWAHGKAVTFMAKWDYGLAGNLGAYPPVAVVARTASRRCSSTPRASTACRR